MLNTVIYNNPNSILLLVRMLSQDDTVIDWVSSLQFIMCNIRRNYLQTHLLFTLPIPREAIQDFEHFEEWGKENE